MHVIGHIRHDEVEPRHRVVGQIARQFRIRADMVCAVIQIVPHGIKENERHMPDTVFAAVGVRTSRAGNVFGVAFPRNSGSVELLKESVGGALVIVRRWIVIADAEIGSRDKPKIVRLTWVSPNG